MTYTRTCPNCGRVFETSELLNAHWEKAGRYEKKREPLIAVMDSNGKPFRHAAIKYVDGEPK